MVALGFTDSRFVGLPVMDLGVAGLVDFVLGCGFCAVGLDGSWWVFVESLACGGLQGVSWWVCGMAHGCGKGCLVDLVAPTGYL